MKAVKQDSGIRPRVKALSKSIGEVLAGTRAAARGQSAEGATPAVLLATGGVILGAALAVTPAHRAMAQADQALEEVTVTGSRIVRRDLTAASPILTIEAEMFQNSSTVSVESVLNQLPQFVPAGSQFTSGIQGDADSSPGAATLNLRGLGTNRNLVLVDGRRAQPVNASLVVDVNTIPASAIANVEIITGGASSVYGPDAMAGVVNFRLKDDFEGITLDFQSGSTAEGDGSESRASILMGMNSADGRGNIMGGLDVTQRSATYQLDRDFYVDGWNDPGTIGGGFISPATWGTNQRLNGVTNPPSQAAVDTLFARYGAAAGQVGPGENFIFNPDGTVFIDTQGGLGYNGPLNCWEGCGSFTGMTKGPNGDLNQQFTEAFLGTPMDRSSTFLRGHYDVADALSVFVQANYSNIEVKTRGGIPPAITVWQAPIPRDGRTLPADLNALLDSRADPAGDWSLYHVLNYQGVIEPVNTSNVWQLMAGIEGELRGGDTTWELYVSSGDTNIEKVNNRMPSLQRYQALVAAPDFGRGTVTGGGVGYNIQCPSGLPVFEQFTPDQSCLTGIDTKMVDNTHLTQDIVEGSIQGRLVDNWAGEIRYAAGATYRENSFQFQPGNPAGAIIDNPIGLFASNATGGSIDVTEYYGELLVPLAESFDLELGYRYSDFSTAGGHDTYKGLFTWQGTDTITLRGGFQQATRAPNVAELFTAPTRVVVFFPGQEPCSATTLATWGNLPSNPDRQQVQDLCRTIIGNNTSDFDTQTYSVLGVNGPDGWHRRNPPFFPLAIELRQGNPAVGPEQGKTYTLGAVFEEAFGADNLILTVDFYQIEIEDTISPVSVSTIYDNCFNRFGSNPTYDISNSFCQLITRNPLSGDRSQVDALFANLGILETKGVDLQVNWSTDFGPGTFAVNSTINVLDSYEYETAPGQGIIDATGTLDRGGLYDSQAFTTFRYSWDRLSLGVNWRYLSSIEDSAAANDPATPNLGTGSYSNFALNLNYALRGYNIRFGIDNLFDEDPNNIGAVNPALDNNAASTSAGLYDVLGRRYFLGVDMQF